MNKKIASLFASVGFDIDTTDLDRLGGILKDVRGSTALLSRNLRSVNTQLSTTATRMRSLATAAEAVTKFNNLGGKYVTLATKVRESEIALARFGRVLKLIEPRLDSTNFRLSTTVRSYQELAAAVRLANQEISRVPNRAPKPVNSNGIGGGGSGGHPTSARTNTGFGAGFLGGLASTVGRFTPTGLAGSTALTSAAVGTNEIRKAGQDIQRMENMLLFSTNAKGAAEAQAEYARNLEFVRKESLRLGLDTAELGKAFAQVNMSAGNKMSEEQRKKMFTDMSEYIMVTGAGQEDQKLIFKAVNQMFSLGRIMAEEMNQLTERGVPRQQLYDIAKEKYGVKDTEAVLKLQEKGKLKPEDLLPLLFEQFAGRARSTGAFAKMQESSIFKQNVFRVQMKQFADEIMKAGLDKALGSFFEVLTAGLPHLLTFLKSLGWMLKGVGLITGAIWDAVTAWGKWIAANQSMTIFIGLLVGSFAMLTAYVTGTTVAVGAFGAAMVAVARKSALLVVLLAMWFLFKEYDKYLKGEDNWMATFQRKIAEMTTDVQLFTAELGLMWRMLKDGEVLNAFGSGAAKSVGKGLLNELMPSWMKVPITEGLLNTPDLPSEVDAWDKLGNPLSRNFNPNYGQGGSNQLEGYLNVAIDMKYPNGVVDTLKVNAPVRTISTGGLLLDS